MIATPRPLLPVPALANAFGEEDACLLQQLVHHAEERVERLRLTNELEEQTMLDALCGVPAATAISRITRRASSNDLERSSTRRPA